MQTDTIHSHLENGSERKIDSFDRKFGIPDEIAQGRKEFVFKL